MKLVTTALTYANGSVHLGHMVEAIQADIYVRFLRFCEEEVIFISGSDAHGTPIMLQAEKQGLDPKVMVESMRKQHLETFKRFNISFDHYHTTDSDLNRSLTYLAFEKLKKANAIATKDIQQAYDEDKGMFLPDRFVKGECPKCGAKDQYGDNCEVCGASYCATELINPISTLSGITPVKKTSTHDFFKLSEYHDHLESWQNSSSLQIEVKNKLNEWFSGGLNDWDITRDHPYFGFNHPDRDGQYFYVWLDAPLGYFAGVKSLDEERSTQFYEQCLNANSDMEIIHFIGKDIAYFHGVFWPAVLMGCEWKVPSELCVHGFLTVNGQKMSKSRGTFILADDYADQLPVDYMRYYLASKLTVSVADLDLNFEDFRSKINSDIVGKLVNIGSRCSKIIHKHFDGKLSETGYNDDGVKELKESVEQIKTWYQQKQYASLIRHVMLMTDKANQFIDLHKPWLMVKDESQKSSAHQVCSQALSSFYTLMGLLKPVMPELTTAALSVFEKPIKSWSMLTDFPYGQTIKPFERLAERIDSSRIDTLCES